MLHANQIFIKGQILVYSCYIIKEFKRTSQLRLYKLHSCHMTLLYSFNELFVLYKHFLSESCLYFLNFFNRNFIFYAFDDFFFYSIIIPMLRINTHFIHLELPPTIMEDKNCNMFLAALERHYLKPWIGKWCKFKYLWAIISF